MNYLEVYAEELDSKSIVALREDRQRILLRPFARRFEQQLRQLHDRPARHVALDRDRVTIGAMHELSPPEQEHLRTMLVSLIPWRKGPFRFYGIDIDAEWRSDFKWNRILELGKPSLQGRRILDVGANNLYYVYRIAAARPEFVLAIDPMPRYFFHAELQRRFVPDLPVSFELFGIEDLSPYANFFDTVFCMGILYHRRNPMESLGFLFDVLRPGGELFLEGVTIDGDGSYFLFPKDRYMKARGYWFIPTAEAFVNMVQRAGFTSVELLIEHRLSAEEQHRTSWSIYESLEHFLDSEDRSKTVEGHPAPNRAYIRAIRT